MKHFKTICGVPLRRTLLVHFWCSLILSAIVIVLVWTLDILGDPNNTDETKRQFVHVLRLIVTYYFTFCLVANPFLLYGIITAKRNFLIPYFVNASIAVTVTIVGGIYIIYLPGQRFIGLAALSYCKSEAFFLYLCVSYYIQMGSTFPKTVDV